MRIFLIAAFLALSTALNTSYAAVCGEFGESKPLSIPVKYSNGLAEEPMYDGSYALIVGASDYQHMGKLPAVKIESTDLTHALAGQGFKVRVICDPPAQGDGGLGEVKRFLTQYGNSGKNRLVVYLSGHGWVDKQGEFGYFAAVDSVDPGKNEDIAKKQGISSQDLIKLTKSVTKGHLIVLVDACYSAAFFNTKSALPPPASTSSIDYEEASQPVRWFLTAGTEGQQTPSPSIFLPALLLGISGYADQLPADGVVRGSELAVYVRHIVANSSGKKTTPRTGYIPTKLGEIMNQGGDPMFRYDAAMKANVVNNIRSAGLDYLVSRDAPAPEAGDWPDPKYRIIYFEKKADNGDVLRALESARLPYLSTRPVLSDATRTNALACHPGAPIAVVKAAARGLIQNGIALRIIDRGRKRGPYDVQLAHFGRVANDRYRDLTLEDLDALDAYETCPNEFTSLSRIDKESSQ